MPISLCKEYEHTDVSERRMDRLGVGFGSLRLSVRGPHRSVNWARGPRARRHRRRRYSSHRIFPEQIRGQLERDLGTAGRGALRASKSSPNKSNTSTRGTARFPLALASVSEGSRLRAAARAADPSRDADDREAEQNCAP